MNPCRIMPPVYFYGAIGVMLVLHVLLPGAGLCPYPWNLLGGIVLLAGVALILRVDHVLAVNGTTVKPHLETTTLITTDAFGYSRHPMYLGFVLVLVGVVVLLGSLTPCLVVPAYILFMDATFIRHEEAKLASEFGEAWWRYSVEVRRWI